MSEDGVHKVILNELLLIIAIFKTPTHEYRSHNRGAGGVNRHPNGI